MVLSGTFTTDNTGTFWLRIYFSAAMVSAVSPDWETSRPRESLDKGGVR